MIINFAYKVILFLTILFAIAASLLTIPSYLEIVAYYKSAVADFHPASDIGTKFLKPKDFIFLKIGLLIYISTAFLLLYFMVFNKKAILRLLYHISTDIQRYVSIASHTLKGLTTRQKIFLAGSSMIVIGLKLYYCLSTQPYIDEVFSFACFVNEGPLVTATFYPVPNNHVFNNLVCMVFRTAGLSAYWSMRLPTLLCWIGTLWLLFLYLKPKLGFKVALCGMILFAILPNLAFFSFFGRGYQLQVLLFICSIIFSHSIWIYKKKRTLLYYILCCVLGCYIAPSYLYCVILLSIYHLFLAIHYNLFFRYTFTAPIAIAMGCIYTYLPILGISGVETLFQNEYVSGSDGWLIVRNFYLLKEIFVAICLLPLLHYLNKKYVPIQCRMYTSLLIHTLYICIACVITFLIIQIVSARLAPERALLWIAYLKVWIVVFAIYSIYMYISNTFKYLLLGTSLLLTCYAGYKRHQDAFRNSYYEGYHEMSECIVNDIEYLDQKRPKSIVTNEIAFYCYWKFKYPEAKNIKYCEKNPENLRTEYMVLNEDTPLIHHPRWRPLVTSSKPCSNRNLYLRINSSLDIDTQSIDLSYFQKEYSRQILHNNYWFGKNHPQ